MRLDRHPIAIRPLSIRCTALRVASRKYRMLHGREGALLRLGCAMIALFYTLLSAPLCEYCRDDFIAFVFRQRLRLPAVTLVSYDYAVSDAIGYDAMCTLLLGSHGDTLASASMASSMRGVIHVSAHR
jgi:hypothetical protein